MNGVVEFFLFLSLTVFSQFLSILIAGFFLRTFSRNKKLILFYELSLMFVLASILFYQAFSITVASIVTLIVGINFVYGLGRIFPQRLSFKIPTLLHFGSLLLIAVSVHEFVEGFGFGASFAYDQTFGMLVAGLVSLHNIPGGIVMSLPFLLSHKMR